MKYQKIIVETSYTVEIGFTEWWVNTRTDDEETIENARLRFRRFPSMASSDELMKLAKDLDFDGFKNAGYINSDGKYIAVFYRNGCTI